MHYQSTTKLLCREHYHQVTGLKCDVIGMVLFNLYSTVLKCRVAASCSAEPVTLLRGQLGHKDKVPASVQYSFLSPACAATFLVCCTVHPVDALCAARAHHRWPPARPPSPPLKQQPSKKTGETPPPPRAPRRAFVIVLATAALTRRPDRHWHATPQRICDLTTR